jgi:hypothetical protein
VARQCNNGGENKKALPRYRYRHLPAILKTSFNAIAAIGSTFAPAKEIDSINAPNKAHQK